MAISSAFSTALTGLKAHQNSLDVVSNNISNASNPDYVRERAVFSSLPSINTTPGDIGTGVEISSVYRITDTFLFNRYTSTSASYANLDTQDQYLKEITTYFPDVTDSGLYKDLEDFFNAWQTLASNPNDASVKVDLAAKTQTLTDNIKTVKGKLEEIQKSINDSLTSKVKEANTIIKQIGDINKEITTYEANGKTNANQLRDKRDALEKRLKELLDVKVYKNGVKSVDAQGVETTDYSEHYQILLGGYPLVDDSTTHELTLDTSTQNPSLYLQMQDFSEKDITKSVTGGEIGALFSLRGTEFDKEGNATNGYLGDMFTKLDALAQGIIRSVNSIYSYSAQENVVTDQINKPNAIPEDLTDVSLDTLYSRYDLLKTPVRDGDLILSTYDSQGNYQDDIKISINSSDSLDDVMKKINDALNDNGIDAQAKMVNGQLKIVDSNGADSPNVLVKDDGAKLFSALNEIEYQPLSKVNDSLDIPMQNGSFDVVVYNDDGDEVARRTIKVDMDSKDPRYSTIEGIVSQMNAPQIDDNQDNNTDNDFDDYYQAEFIDGKFVLAKKTDETTYVGLDNDSADFGGAMGVNKFLDGSNASDITLNKKFQDDPSLINAGKTPNSGDNSVANAMLQLQYEKVNFNVKNTTTSSTIYEFYRGMTSDLANQADTVNSKKETTKTLLTSITNEYQSLSGVNIDEELINLEKFQRGYQANAKVITTINQMLDSLLAIKQ